MKEINTEDMAERNEAGWGAGQLLMHWLGKTSFLEEGATELSETWVTKEVPFKGLEDDHSRKRLQEVQGSWTENFFVVFKLPEGQHGWPGRGDQKERGIGEDRDVGKYQMFRAYKALTVLRFYSQCN